MINVTNVVSFLLDRVEHEYKHEKTTVTPQERDIAFQLFLTLQSVLESPGTIEKETVLDFGDTFEFDNYDELEEEIEYSQESVSSQSSQEWEFLEIDREKFDLDYMKRAVEYYDKSGWKSTQHNFRRLKHRTSIISTDFENTSSIREPNQKNSI